MLLLTTWSLVLVYYMASNGRLGLIGCFLYYMQTIAIMVSSHSSLTAWVRTFGFSPVTLMPAACFGPHMSPELQYAMPLLIVPLQLVQLVVTVAVHWMLRRRYSQAGTRYALDELSMTYVRSGGGGGGGNERQHVERLNVDVVDDEQQQRWYVRHARSLQQRLVTLVRYRVWPELCVSTVARAVFLIVSASFTSVLVTCVSWFHCTADMAMGGSGSAAVSGSVVYAFPAVSCYTSHYYRWSWLMGACMATWLLIILAVAWWMVKQRRQLAALQRRAPLNGQAPAGSLHPLGAMALRPNVATERVNVQLPAPFTRWMSFAWFWPTAPAGSGWDEPVCDSGVAGVVMETRREYAFRSLYGALYDSFRGEASGWMVVVWVRRLLLIVLSVVLTTLPSAKYLSFLLLHLVIICMHSYFQPFTTAALNDTERVSILVHIVIAAVLTAYPSPTNGAVQSSVLTLTIAPLVMYLLYRQAQTYSLRAERRLTVKMPGLRVRNDVLSAPLLESGGVEL